MSVFGVWRVVPRHAMPKLRWLNWPSQLRWKSATDDGNLGQLLNTPKISCYGSTDRHISLRSFFLVIINLYIKTYGSHRP